MLRSDRVRPVAADARTYHLVQVEQLYLTTYIRLDLQQLVSLRRDDRHRHKLRYHSSYSYVKREEDVQIKSLSRHSTAGPDYCASRTKPSKAPVVLVNPVLLRHVSSFVDPGDPRLLSQCLFKEDEQECLTRPQSTATLTLRYPIRMASRMPQLSYTGTTPPDAIH